MHRLGTRINLSIVNPVGLNVLVRALGTVSGSARFWGYTVELEQFDFSNFSDSRSQRHRNWWQR